MIHSLIDNKNALVSLRKEVYNVDGIVRPYPLDLESALFRCMTKSACVRETTMTGRKAHH